MSGLPVEGWRDVCCRARKDSKCCSNSVHGRSWRYLNRTMCVIGQLSDIVTEDEVDGVAGALVEGVADVGSKAMAILGNMRRG